jgi:glucosylceramidase
MLVQTAHGTDDKLTQKEDIHFYDDFALDGPTVDLTSLEMDQSITGFGGAFTEAAALVFQNMSSENQAKLLEKYFDKDKGIGYTLGRVPINSCDFSPDPARWTLDDFENDTNLDHFDSNATKDREAVIPLIKAAMEKLKENGRELKLFASSWSPPAWMKTNANMLGGGKLKDEYHATWANYHVKWIDAYKAAGVDIWGITPQNEPENPAGWESCVWTAQEEADWIGSELGPKLKAAHPNVLIFPFDHNKDHVQLWAETMYSHPTASQYIAGMSFHWYSGDQFDHVAQIHDRYPDAILLPSEATWEKYRWSAGTTIVTGEWSFGAGYAHDILGDLNVGAVGWTDWNLLLNQKGGPNHMKNWCDAPMMADDKELYLHPQYYFMGHFSKYLVPGSRRMKIQVTGSPSYTGGGRGYGVCTEEDGLEATAFQRPDGSIAVVVLNCGAQARNFKIKDSVGSAAVQIPGASIQTIVLQRNPKPSVGLYV